MRTSLALQALLVRGSFLPLAAFALTPAHADDQATPPASDTPPAAAAAPAPPAPPAPFVKFSGHAEVGVTTRLSPTDAPLNWGHLFTDRDGQPLINQVMLTAQHDIDSSAKTPNWGFKVQGFWGSDARVTHLLGVLDSSPNSINQFDIVEAHVDAHLPIIASGGVDIKAGLYPTLLGAEVIDSTANFFYSHNYIFNFGVPLKHTGVMTTTHFSHGIDLYLGVDSDVNTSFGSGGDNNGAPAFQGGIGFTVGKNATVLITTHIGPEDARGSFDFNGKPINTNKALRYLNDAVITIKLSPKLTSTTDINYIHDDGYHVSGGGISEQLVYTFNDNVSFGARGEIWDDGNGYFVAAFPGNHDFVANEKGLGSFGGLPNTSIFAPGVDATYAALTVGINWKPKVPAVTKNFSVTVRPEARVDTTLNGVAVFGLNKANTPTKKGQATVGVDLIVGF